MTVRLKMKQTSGAVRITIEPASECNVDLSRVGANSLEPAPLG